MTEIHDHIRAAAAYAKCYEREAEAATIDGEDRSVIEWLQRLSFVHAGVVAALEAQEAELEEQRAKLEAELGYARRDLS